VVQTLNANSVLFSLLLFIRVIRAIRGEKFRFKADFGEQPDASPIRA
jgi:hypothetical protein